MKKESFEIKFYDTDVHPNTISVRELSDVLAALENGIEAIAEKEFPNFTTGSGLLALVGVKEGCAALHLEHMAPAVSGPALECFTKSIAENNTSSLPGKAQKAIAIFERFNAKHNCITNIKRDVASKQPDAVIKIPKLEASHQSRMISNETEVFAKVTKVGGTKKPSAELQIEGHRSSIHAQIGSTELAKSIGAKLYETVMLAGIAQVKMPENEIVSFEIKALRDYKETNISEALSDIRNKYSVYFNKIKDVDDYICTLRGEG